MRRRTFLPLLLLSVPALAIEPEADAVRGKLIAGPSVRTANGQTISLSGDDPTMLVLNDERLSGADLEVHGHTRAPGQFVVDKIHTRSLFAYQKGKKLMITYWCDVCYIRTFAPGPCWCCQEYTKLDLIDPDTVD
ncbi:MAG: hypothetical protein ABJF23_06205 [Bryobacteraceae bacterium]